MIVFFAITFSRIINLVLKAAHSTSYQLHRVFSHFKNRRAQGESIEMLILDMERAFDAVWHDALVHKLILRGCNIFLVWTIYSFLNDHTFQVSVGNSKSPISNIPYGVPQGAVLSPTLYNFFTSDAQTVDDTVLFVSSFRNNSTHWLTTSNGGWKIKVNSSKTQSIYFTICWSPLWLLILWIVLNE
jgi:hypothetical protein